MTDPPIPNQTYALISLNLFREPKNLRNGVPVYGFFKVRGVCAEESQAKMMGAKIIREVDSRYQVRVAPVGAWLPITDENGFVRDIVDVRLKEDEVHLRDEAIKEKQARERQILRELREREEDVKSGDTYDDPQSLTFYAMRRVTENKLFEARDRVREQVSAVAKKLRRVQKELKRLELQHPEYAEQWVEVYNLKRREVGIPDFVPDEEQEREHTSTTFESLEDSDEEYEGKGKEASTSLSVQPHWNVQI
jgi:hypothetical protein